MEMCTEKERPFGPSCYRCRRSRKNYIMSTKPAIKATGALSSAASKDLVSALAGVRLTSDRRDALRQYAAAADRAFKAPLPQGVSKRVK
jgi:hypothetical protein